MAEAVSLRKGSHYDHQNFTGGVKGEVTYDTGNKTLWTHNGDGTIGTELARADFENCAIHNLGSELAFKDLSNVNSISNLSVVANAFEPVLAVNGYTKKTYVDSQINTRMDKNLSNITDTGKINLATLTVKKNLSNFNTAIAAGEIPGLPSGSEPLAYKDMSNINTANLATGRSGTSGDNNLLYSDLSNIDTITSSSDVLDAGIQTTDQLVDVSSANSITQYPTALSVKTRLDNIVSLPQVNPVESKSQVYASCSYGYQYTAQVVSGSGGTGYAKGDNIHLATTTTEGKFVILQASIEEVNNGAIVSVILQNDYGQEAINQTSVPVITDTGSGQNAHLSISSTNIGYSGLNWSTLSDFEPSDILFNNETSDGGKYIEEREEPITNVKTALETLGLNQQEQQHDNAITEITVTDTTGVITVKTKRAMTTNPTVKALIGGTLVVGTWNTVDTTTRKFTPNNPNAVLTNSWIVVL